MQEIEDLRGIADETLGGLQADDAMRRAILARAERSERKPLMFRRAMPALACAAALLCVLGISGALKKQNTLSRITDLKAGGEPVLYAMDSAGAEADGEAVSEEAETAAVFSSVNEESFPTLMLGGRCYRQTAQEQTPDASLLGETLGSVAGGSRTASAADTAGSAVSDALAEGTEIRTIGGMPATSAVAVQTEDGIAVFQRCGYEGVGPGSESLEDTFCARDRAVTCTLEGTGTLQGDAAKNAVNTLLDNAVCVQQDYSGTPGKTLTVTLDNGITLTLGVSDGLLCGCGVWDCPEFFDAFDAAEGSGN